MPQSGTSCGSDEPHLTLLARPPEEVVSGLSLADLLLARLSVSQYLGGTWAGATSCSFQPPG